MSDEKTSDELKEIIDRESNIRTPRKVRKVSKVALIVFPFTIITAALLILAYYLIFCR